MRLSEFASVRRVATAGSLAAILWAGQARADVLDQVPSDALAVVKIKSLEQTNSKVAKMAKAFGLDELQPEMKDPLSALLEKGHITKGINRQGDAALVLFAPEKGAAKEEPVAVALVPVSDYDAFVGNFKKADGGEGDVSAVVDPEEASKTMFIAHHGDYAVLSDQKGHLAAKGGLKLTKATAKEAAAKDIIFVFNMPVARGLAIPAMQEHRKEWIDAMHKGLSGQEPLKKFVPVFDTVVNEVLDGVESFLKDTDSVAFSINLSDAGLTGSALIDFAPDSKFGKTIAEIKPSQLPLLAGLPDRKYFLFGGSSSDRKVGGRLASEWLDPIIKDLANTDTPTGKQIGDLLETLKTVVSSADHSAAGWVVPTKPLGQESLFQQIQVVYGDSNAIAGAEKKMLTQINDLAALAPQNQGVKTKIEFGEAKNVDGVELQSFSTKMEFDPNNAQGMQAQQLLGMLYGPKGMSGNFGVVNDKTFIITQGADDELLKELIGSAKAGKDALSQNAGVKAVASQLPENRSAIYFVALDNIVTTAVRYAQGFGLPIKMKLPENLPPIGISAGTDESSVRVDGFIPTETVQSLVSAGIQAYTQMQKGGGGL